MSITLLDEKNLNAVLDGLRDIKKGLSSGFYDLDFVTTGFQEGEIYVLGGRPSMGKTMLATNIVYSIAVEQEQPVLYVSLDQSKEMIAARLLQRSSGEELKNLFLRNVSQVDMVILRKAASDVGKGQIWIEDTPEIRVETLRELIKENNKNWGVKFIVIDYLQLMKSSGSFQSRQEEVAEIIKVLKYIAKENDLSILILSQLNRYPEYRPDHRPMLSDLRDSGVIEEYADYVYLMYRDDYYYTDSEKKGIAEIIIAKNKLGPRGTINLKFLPQKGRFKKISSFEGDL